MEECFYCGSREATTCKWCGLLSSCKNHVDIHRINPEGLNTASAKEGDGFICLPFTIRSTKDKGNSLFAVRDIKPYEIILKDEPAIIGLTENDKPRCLGCFKELKDVHLCSQCNLPLCSSACEQAKRHQPECFFFNLKKNEHLKRRKIDIDKEDYLKEKSNIRNVVFTAVTVARLFKMKEDCAKIWERVDKLCDHVEERRERPAWAYVKNHVLPVIISDEDGGKAQEPFFERLIGINRTNSVRWDHDVGEGKRECVGHGLCPIFSLLCHSCISNTRYLQTDEFIVVRACVFIRAGEEITTQYKGPTDGNIIRRRDFPKNWLFNCNCIRCLDPTELGTMVSSLKCSNCSSGYLLPRNSDMSSDWFCKNCDNERKYESVLEYTLRMEENVLAKQYTESVESWESLLSDLQKDFHPNHFLCMYVKRNLLQLYGSRETHLLQKLSRKQLEYKVELCENYIEIYSKLEPGYRTWRSRVLEELLPTYALLLKHIFETDELDKTQQLMKYKRLLDIVKEAGKCRQFELEQDQKQCKSFYDAWMAPMQEILSKKAN